MYAEEAHQGIGLVLRTAGVAARRPRETVGDAEVGEGAAEGEGVAVDACDLLKDIGEVVLFSEYGSVVVEEDDAAGGEQLLQRPCASKVCASAKGGSGSAVQTRIGEALDIGEIDEADRRLRVPLVHGSDSF